MIRTKEWGQYSASTVCSRYLQSYTASLTRSPTHPSKQPLSLPTYTNIIVSDILDTQHSEHDGFYQQWSQGPCGEQLQNRLLTKESYDNRRHKTKGVHIDGSKEDVSRIGLQSPRRKQLLSHFDFRWQHLDTSCSRILQWHCACTTQGEHTCRTVQCPISCGKHWWLVHVGQVALRSGGAQGGGVAKLGV